MRRVQFNPFQVTWTCYATDAEGFLYSIVIDDKKKQLGLLLWLVTSEKILRGIRTILFNNTTQPSLPTWNTVPFFFTLHRFSHIIPIDTVIREINTWLWLSMSIAVYNDLNNICSLWCQSLAQRSKMQSKWLVTPYKQSVLERSSRKVHNPLILLGDERAKLQL